MASRNAAPLLNPDPANLAIHDRDPRVAIDARLRSTPKSISYTNNARRFDSSAPEGRTHANCLTPPSVSRVKLELFTVYKYIDT